MTSRTTAFLISCLTLLAPSWGSLESNVAKLRVQEIREQGGVLTGLVPADVNNPSSLIWRLILEEFGDRPETGKGTPWTALGGSEEVREGEVVAGLGWDAFTERFLFFSGVSRGVGTLQLAKSLELAYVIETSPPTLRPDGSPEPGRLALIGLAGAAFFRLDPRSELYARRAVAWDQVRRDAIAFNEMLDVRGDQIAMRQGKLYSLEEWQREGSLRGTVAKQWLRLQLWLRESLRRGRAK